MVKFVDLFSGIGGFRIALERLRCECVFPSEINKFARHDLLVGGFPCQGFSIAGVSKNNSMGRKHGFAHEQGNLFFEILRILKSQRPRAFLLENVKNLLRHDKGKTWEIMQARLQDLGYSVHWKIIDASLIVPQKRERMYIVGLRDHLEFEFPDIKPITTCLADILEDSVDEKYTLRKTWEALQKHKLRHEEVGHGFTYSIFNTNTIRTRTLTKRYYKDGSEILIEQEGGNPRRLTPRECARLMGFPESFIIPVSDTQAYQQFGNSVIPGIIEEVAKEILRVIE